MPIVSVGICIVSLTLANARNAEPCQISGDDAMPASEGALLAHLLLGALAL